MTFKDNVLANARPDLAIIDTRTEKPWIDNEKLAWVDPFREEVWNYNIALAKEAAARGFDGDGVGQGGVGIGHGSPSAYFDCCRRSLLSVARPERA